MDRLTLEVLWNRLVSVVNEQAAALMRTSFTSIVREAGDLSAGVFEQTLCQICGLAQTTFASDVPIVLCRRVDRGSYLLTSTGHAEWTVKHAHDVLRSLRCGKHGIERRYTKRARVKPLQFIRPRTNRVSVETSPRLLNMPQDGQQSVTLTHAQLRDGEIRLGVTSLTVVKLGLERSFAWNGLAIRS